MYRQLSTLEYHLLWSWGAAQETVGIIGSSEGRLKLFHLPVGSQGQITCEAPTVQPGLCTGLPIVRGQNTQQTALSGPREYKMWGLSVYQVESLLKLST